MVLFFLAGVIGFQQGDALQQLEVLRLSSRANKDAFAFGTFKFEYTRGYCESFKDAEAEVFSKAVKEEGLYVFDGKNARYDLIAAPNDIAAMTTRIGERKASSTVSAYRMLTDGDVTLLDQHWPDKSGTGFDHTAKIRIGRQWFYSDAFFVFPLWIGDEGARDYDLFSDLSGIKDGKASLVELNVDADLDGLKVCKLTLEWKGGKRTYWVDLNRGSVPLRILDRYGPADQDVIFVFSDLVHIPDTGWLPRRRLHILGGGHLADRLVVTQVDTKNKPPASVFALDFPKPVRMVNDAKKLVYAPQKTWSLLKLPGRSSPGTRVAIPRSFVRPSELPGEIEAGPPWAIILPAGVVVLVVLGSLLILRRRTQRPQGV